MDRLPTCRSTESVVGSSTHNQELIASDLDVRQTDDGGSHKENSDDDEQNNTESNEARTGNEAPTDQPNPNPNPPPPSSTVHIIYAAPLSKASILSQPSSTPTYHPCRLIPFPLYNSALHSWHYTRASTLSHLNRSRPQNSNKSTLITRRAIDFIERETSEEEVPSEMMQSVCLRIKEDSWCLVNGSLERWIEGWEADYGVRRGGEGDWMEDEVGRVVRAVRGEMGECVRAVEAVRGKGKGGRRGGGGGSGGSCIRRVGVWGRVLRAWREWVRRVVSVDFAMIVYACKRKSVASESIPLRCHINNASSIVGPPLSQ